MTADLRSSARSRIAPRCALVAAVVLTPTAALAQSTSVADAPAAPVAPAASATGEWVNPRIALRYDLRIDVPVTAVSAVAWVVPELLKGPLTGSSCRLCERNPDGTSAVNGLDLAFRGLRWATPGGAALVSDVLAFGLAPASALLLPGLLAARDGSIEHWPIDALLVAEAAAIAMASNQLVKFIALRERPRYQFADPAERMMYSPPGDELLSFFSGHATFTFSLACAAGTIVSMRSRRLAPVVWGVGLTIATATTYLRMAADKHYFTDVFTGALIGSAVGVLVPWLAHRPLTASGARLSFAPSPGGGLSATLSGAF
jgi:membrane-associated phospholipid phosphatase